MVKKFESIQVLVDPAQSCGFLTHLTVNERIYKLKILKSTVNKFGYRLTGKT